MGINESNNANLRAVWAAALQILYLELLGCINDNWLTVVIFDQCAYVAVSIPDRFYSIKLRLNSKQLV